MPYATIAKEAKGAPAIAPNLRDYGAERTPDFWARARRELDGLPDGRVLNIAHEAVDGHAAGMACTFAAPDGLTEEQVHGAVDEGKARAEDLDRQLHETGRLSSSPARRASSSTTASPATTIAAVRWARSPGQRRSSPPSRSQRSRAFP